MIHTVEHSSTEPATLTIQMNGALNRAWCRSTVLPRMGNHMMVPSCSARLLNFFCSRSQKSRPANPNAMTAQLNPLLMGNNTEVKVHSTN